jgi:hypothetical protein
MSQDSLNHEELICLFQKAKEKFSAFPAVIEKIENLIKILQSSSNVSVDEIMEVVDEMNRLYKENFVVHLELSGERNQIICNILIKIGFGFLVREKGD